MQSVKTLTRLFFYNEREVNSMKLNKERFLKTELGGSLKDCVTSWDIALDACRKHAYYTDEYKRERKVADWCQAQWEVYKMAANASSNSTKVISPSPIPTTSAPVFRKKYSGSEAGP